MHRIRSHLEISGFQRVEFRRQTSGCAVYLLILSAPGRETLLLCSGKTSNTLAYTSSFETPSGTESLPHRFTLELRNTG